MSWLSSHLNRLDKSETISPFSLRARRAMKEGVKVEQRSMLPRQASCGCCFVPRCHADLVVPADLRYGRGAPIHQWQTRTSPVPSKTKTE
jgi:hypothetical protein